MYTYKKLLFILVMGSLSFTSCQQEKFVGPLDENDQAVPGVVSNVQVENLHGGARLTYSLPKDADLFYVEADYEIRPGVIEQAKSSYYNNSMTIQGFGDTTEHQVRLYAVDRSENKSQPVTVMVKPLVSPVQDAYRTLAYEKDFGGIHVSYQNQNMANLVINVMIKDSTGAWEDYDKYYSSRADGAFSVRGLPSVETTFGVFIRDRWENHSDTLVKSLVPIYEEQLDKTNFRDMSAYLPGTPSPYSGSYHMEKLWDNDINSMYHTTQNVSDGAGFPLHFAFDLGTKAKLSRIKEWPRQGDWIYTHGNVKDMEIWGTNNDPSTWNPFSFNGWIKLGEFHSFKPSGEPVGTNTEEDAEYAAAGEEIELPIGNPSVRYIMFNVIDNWSQPANDPSGFIHIAEVTFWGQPEP